jgi:Tol biopolymer transport system component
VSDSPRDGLVAYATQEGIMGFDPTAGVTTVIVPGSELCCPEWSPDGRRLAFWVMTLCCKGGGTFEGRVHVVDADGSWDRELSGSRPVPSSYLDGGLSWSSDSRRLAYPGSGAVFIVDVESGERLGLLTGTRQAAWSPVEDMLAYALPAGLGAPDRQLGIVLGFADGSEQRVLADEVGAFGPVTWSPDGNALAFACCDGTSDDGTKETHIWSVGIDGELRQLTHGDSFDGLPVWSPDGQLIAFQRTRGGPRARVLVVGADGADATRVTDVLPSPGAGGRVASLRWSPDGTRLLIVPYRAGHLEIVGTVGDSEPVTLEMSVGTASWQPQRQ